MLTLRTAALILMVILTACNPTAGKRHTTTQKNEEAQGSPAARIATSDESGMVAALIDPAKLATLKSRGANPRILKITAILYTVKQTGRNPETIVAGAIKQIGWEKTEKGNLTAASILRNLDIAEKLGSTTAEDIENMRRGKSPTVRKGPYAGDIVSIDHIIPRAIVPELDNVIANLELMPLKLNESKNDKIGDRQRSLARQLHAAGLLENPGKVR